MADQPSPSAARGPRAPAPGASPLSAHGPTDPAAAQGATNPLPAGAAETSAGRNLYAIYCVPCHGASGTGVDSAVGKYFPRVGDLSGADVQQHEDGWLYAIVTSGTSTMPSYGHELTTRERWQIVRFVRTLAR
jgi:mono/diheme cytochrome c family protein